MGLLPWERWLPPWLFGPLLASLGVALMVWGRPLSLFGGISAVLCIVYGAGGTVYWALTRRNPFDPTSRARGG